MKTRNQLSKALIYLSMLFMMSFISCEKQECKVCVNSADEEMTVCTAEGEAMAYFLGYYNCY